LTNALAYLTNYRKKVLYDWTCKETTEVIEIHESVQRHLAEKHLADNFGQQNLAVIFGQQNLVVMFGLQYMAYHIRPTIFC
jgi:hypothetical protein